MNQPLHERASAVLAKVMDLPSEKAKQLILQECADDSALLQEVMTLFNEFSLEQEQSTEPTPNKTETASKIKVQKLDSIFVKSKAHYDFFSKKGPRMVLAFTVLLLLIVLGEFVRSSIKRVIINSELEEKVALLETTRQVMLDWIDFEKERLQRVAQDDFVITLVQNLNNISDQDLTPTERDQLLLSLSNKLRRLEKTANFEYLGILHLDVPEVQLSTVMATDSTLSIFNDLKVGEGFYAHYNELKRGETIFVPPLHDREAGYDVPEDFKGSANCIFGTPVKNDQGQTIAYLYSISMPQNQFSKIFNIAHHGRSSEIYALDNEGRMVSESRFIKDIKPTLLLDSGKYHTAVYNLELLNPGGNILEGYVPDVPRFQWPFTEVVQDIQAHLIKRDSVFSGGIHSAYRDYRGIMVVGAWLWLPEYDFGMIAEEDEEEVLSMMWHFDLILGVFYLIIAVLLYLLYNSNIDLARFSKKIHQLDQLGQYRLIEKIGEGGFGEVHKAEHSLLRLPVAVKMLKKNIADQEAIARFEKEVAITSMLKHPNTINVFDFGTTEQGVFYYVMEFIDGLPLDKVLKMHEPFPIERCISILKQVCYSLQEAHQMNFVHRDIKPMNIMISQLGGAYDHVKLLDFGLVKDLDVATELQTQAGKIGGTPLFMAPERIRDPFNNDARVDIYSLGALGLYMLSGKYLVELISQKVFAGDQTMNADYRNRLIEREDVPEDLKNILMECVRFDPEKRVQHVEQIIMVLETLEREYPWSRTDAQNWWKTYEVYG
ncbi:serine/threonine-protein kinase [Persicobacter psychrovividus]|uniref:Serine/threonine protein kinase n=1 Tax=Persicobacter psychrovividus TaxID=387638 RepID=A0ABM7VME9_9BACT|nr:serine/threonine protein kinase [Persicobacter psychrovividus]